MSSNSSSLPSSALLTAGAVVLSSVSYYCYYYYVSKAQTKKTSRRATVTSLHRYPVKGLGANETADNSLETIHITDHCFPDDRRYALWRTDAAEAWHENTWVHKQNFLCAYTRPELLAKYRTDYHDDDGTLTLHDRSTGAVLVGPVAMPTKEGRDELAAFLSKESGTPLQCVTSVSGKFQFGNTNAAVRKNNDDQCRCMHLVFQSSVDALAEALGRPIRASRFRPNIVLATPPSSSSSTSSAVVQPFAEDQWVGKTLRNMNSTLKLKVLSRTVRCPAIGVDPLDNDDSFPGSSSPMFELPELIAKHFPQQGPYLGIYCVLEQAGSLSIGDELVLVE